MSTSNRSAVIFGAGGQLGVELKHELTARGYQVHTFERTQIDITSQATVEQCISRIDPEMVFNSAAYNQVDVAETEPQAAFLVNALAVRNIALACRQVDARLIHFSTDYVFDGSATRPYVETDPTHPLGAYAVSKLGGELYAQAYLDAPLIVRTCGVYGPQGIKTARGNFVETMLRLARSGNPIQVVEDYVASPTYAPALAARTCDLAERGSKGVFHIGGGASISWFDFARTIFAAAGVAPRLQPSNERSYRTPARRPKYSVLSNAKMESAGVAPMPTIEVAVGEYMARSAAQRG
jgi:dTDP-4-dehydrorhamnose reductase